MSLTKARAHLFISGRVQGVFFRSQTAHQAERLRVSGWVRNCEDGRVEAVFEGEKESLESLVEFCRHGPPGARVESVAVSWEEYSGKLTGFEIGY